MIHQKRTNMVKNLGYIFTICLIEIVSMVQSNSQDSPCGYFNHSDVSAIVKSDGKYYEHIEYKLSMH